MKQYTKQVGGKIKKTEYEQASVEYWIWDKYGVISKVDNNLIAWIYDGKNKVWNQYRPERQSSIQADMLFSGDWTEITKEQAEEYLGVKLDTIKEINEQNKDGA